MVLIETQLISREACFFPSPADAIPDENITFSIRNLISYEVLRQLKCLPAAVVVHPLFY